MKNRYITLISLGLTGLLFLIWKLVYGLKFINLLNSTGLLFAIWFFLTFFTAIHSFKSHKIWTIVILLTFVFGWNIIIYFDLIPSIIYLLANHFYYSKKETQPLLMKSTSNY